MLAANADARVTYAIRRFADTGKLAGLVEQDVVIVNTAEGKDYLALWPHSLFADRLRSQYGLSSDVVEYSSRSLRRLFEDAPGLAGIALFPTSEHGGVGMSLGELFARLRDERARFG